METGHTCLLVHLKRTSLQTMVTQAHLAATTQPGATSGSSRGDADAPRGRRSARGKRPARRFIRVIFNLSLPAADDEFSLVTRVFKQPALI